MKYQNTGIMGQLQKLVEENEVNSKRCHMNELVIQMSMDFLIAILEAKRQWKQGIQFLKRKNVKPRILCTISYA